MTNVTFGNNSFQPSLRDWGYLLPPPTLERVGYYQNSLREKGGRVRGSNQRAYEPSRRNLIDRFDRDSNLPEGELKVARQFTAGSGEKNTSPEGTIETISHRSSCSLLGTPFSRPFGTGDVSSVPPPPLKGWAIIRTPSGRRRTRARSQEVCDKVYDKVWMLE
jgi:hypothetical protein